MDVGYFVLPDTIYKLLFRDKTTATVLGERIVVDSQQKEDVWPDSV